MDLADYPGERVTRLTNANRSDGFAHRFVVLLRERVTTIDTFASGKASLFCTTGK